MPNIPVVAIIFLPNTDISKLDVMTLCELFPQIHAFSFTVTLPRLILQAYVNKIKQTNGRFLDLSDKNRRIALPVLTA